MSANIKSISMFVDNRLININFQGYKLVCLSGATEYKDTALYVLEKFLANDFSSYYDEIDSNLGFNYKNVQGTCRLQFKDGFSTYSANRLTNNGSIPKIHCIRYTKSGRIRSFLLSPDLSDEVIGSNMTVFSSVISDSKWNRLVALVNNLVGYEVVTLDIKTRKISFDIHSYNDWTEDAVKFVYLLISESMLTPDRYTRVTLLSEIDILNTSQIAELIKTLSSISRNEVIIFSDALPVNILGYKYNILNVSV